MKKTADLGIRRMLWSRVVGVLIN